MEKKTNERATNEKKKNENLQRFYLSWVSRSMHNSNSSNVYSFVPLFIHHRYLLLFKKKINVFLYDLRMVVLDVILYALFLEASLRINKMKFS